MGDRLLTHLSGASLPPSCRSLCLPRTGAQPDGASILSLTMAVTICAEQQGQLPVFLLALSLLLGLSAF